MLGRVIESSFATVSQLFIFHGAWGSLEILSILSAIVVARTPRLYIAYRILTLPNTTSF